MVWGRVRARAILGVLAAVFGIGVSTPLLAQVLQIDAEGIKTFSGPAVHTADSVLPITTPSPALPAGSPASTSEKILLAAAIANISPELIQAVAWCESRMRSDAVSRAGAIGAMQLMPATARALGVDALDAQQNYIGGALYLAGMLRRYDGDLRLALAAYNAGPGAVDRYGGVPPFKETQRYVTAVLDRLNLMVR